MGGLMQPAKGLKQLLSGAVNPVYRDNMPDSQHGAVPGRGTDNAAHLVHCFVAHCAASDPPCLAWFADMARTLGCIVRQSALGWPADALPMR